MYSIDGIALHQSAKHWRLKSTSQINVAHAHTLNDFNASGRDGTVQVRGFIATPTITLAVTTDGTNLYALRRLFTLGKTLSLSADATKGLNIELQSLTDEKWTDGGTDIYLVVGVFRVPDVFWRDAAVVDYGPTALTATGQSFSCLATTDAVVRDALVCVAGSITGLQVTAQAGTYFGYPPNVPGGQFLTFDSASGRAWTGASAFAKTTEVTGSITNGPGPYYLEIGAASSDPAVTGCAVVVTYSAASSATVRVRARNAFNR